MDVVFDRVNSSMFKHVADKTRELAVEVRYLLFVHGSGSHGFGILYLKNKYKLQYKK